MARKKPTDDGVRLVDLSPETPTPSVDQNNHARTRVAGFSPELERAHRKIAERDRRIAELEGRVQQLTDHNRKLKRHLRRRTLALRTGFVTLEAKAAFCMSISAWGDQQWWANLGQAAGVLAVAVYLITPNVRRLLRLSSDTATDDES